jgi:hypothetical protein
MRYRSWTIPAPEAAWAWFLYLCPDRLNAWRLVKVMVENVVLFLTMLGHERDKLTQLGDRMLLTLEIYNLL